MTFGARRVAPGSTTLPEAAIGRPRSAEALDPPAHPRVPLPPPAPLDVATVVVGGMSAAATRPRERRRDGSTPRKPPSARSGAQSDNVALAKIATDNPMPRMRNAALPRSELRLHDILLQSLQRASLAQKKG